jgi:uncharacterized protein (DUF1810 family)
MDDFDLARFRSAQERTFAQAHAELTAGRKRSHWMWFIFPQLRGLGRSETARFYGVGSLAEAQAYLADPVLGPRLVEASALTLTHEGETAREIFGAPDDLKLRSCATLFASVPDAPPVFQRVLARFFEGVADERTLAMLQENPGQSGERVTGE